MVIGTAVASIPAALVMQRFGRRRGFVLGAGIAAVAGLLAATAVALQSFFAFSLATLLIGVNSAFAQQYRFAAMESVAPDDAGHAVSYVLIGGVVGGILGPEIGRRTRLWLEPEWSASFLTLAAVYAVVALLHFKLYRDTVEVSAPKRSQGGRPIAKIAATPEFLVAVASGVVAYATMSLVMTATPVSMHVMDGHSLAVTTTVIQGHVVAMFLPSLFTGALVTRLGVPRVLVAGTLTLAASVAVCLMGRTVPSYLGGLVLLGLGWNLLWVAATVQLGTSYRPEERFRAQALNDFSVLAVQATASLSAGAILATAGWRTLVLLPVPALVLLLASIGWWVRRSPAPAVAG
jgi:MFS family permease